MKKEIRLKEAEFFIETIENTLNSENEKVYDISESKMKEILSLIAQIDDKQLRLSLISKLGVE
jgi:hypothetical protein